MSAEVLIKSKLQLWAIRKGIPLIGSKIIKGGKYYTQNRNDNFFLPPSLETVNDFKNANGQEFGNGIDPGKIQALHSSSALAVNFFEYWKASSDKQFLAKGLKIPSNNITDIRFEQKYPILPENHPPPNIDVKIQYEDKNVCAIECKFTEAYSKRENTNGIQTEYIKNASWTGLSNLLAYAKSICPIDVINNNLHAAQLIKHTLGLMKIFQDKKSFRLLYLWYDANGEEGSVHRRELESFSEIIKKDGISFQSITWQELITNMANKHFPAHKDYFDYIAERYL